MEGKKITSVYTRGGKLRQDVIDTLLNRHSYQHYRRHNYLHPDPRRFYPGDVGYCYVFYWDVRCVPHDMTARIGSMCRALGMEYSILNDAPRLGMLGWYCKYTVNQQFIDALRASGFDIN